MEKSLKPDHNSFCLDHFQGKHRFPLYFNDVLLQVILARLGLGQKPRPELLKSLWQWIPEGYRLVPVFPEPSLS